MEIEKGLYDLKIKILRSEHISDTFKKELANDLFKIEKKVKSNYTSFNTQITSLNNEIQEMIERSKKRRERIKEIMGNSIIPPTYVVRVFIFFSYSIRINTNLKPHLRI